MLAIYPAQTNEDIEIIKELLNEYVSSWFDYEGPTSDEEVQRARGHIDNLVDNFGPPDGCLLIAKYADQPAGCVALEKFNDQICLMKRLYVTPDFRSQKIGRKLAESVIEHAQRIGYEQMRIHTVTAFERACKLYNTLGFTQIDEFEHTEREDAVFMELKLI